MPKPALEHPDANGERRDRSRVRQNCRERVHEAVEERVSVSGNWDGRDSHSRCIADDDGEKGRDGPENDEMTLRHFDSRSGTVLGRPFAHWKLAMPHANATTPRRNSIGRAVGMMTTINAKSAKVIRVAAL